MPISLVVNNITYNYPSPGEDPGWGEDATGWAEAVTEVLNSILGPGDLLETTFSVANNQATLANITGLFFNPSSVRAAVIEYSIYRVSTSNLSGNAESGVLEIIYDDSAAASNKWLIKRDHNGDAGIDIDILDSGQIQYKSSDIGAAGYIGTMKFRARSLST
jgi:hypothetical protein